MNAETIKSFLVSLGFDVDDAGMRKFDATLVSVTTKAIKLGVAVEAAALSVVAFTTKIASGLDELYWASQRTGAMVAGIQAIGYAASQTGSSAAAARSSLESLARFMRNSPGAEGFLNRLGVQTRDASGQMRSMESIFSGVGQRLSNMPYYRANQYASMLGIDENTLMAMRRGMGEFGAQYSATAKTIGFNADVAAKSSNRFMTSMREFTMMAGMARDKIGSSLTDGLASSLDHLRKQILDNFPAIERGIMAIIKGILWLSDVIGRAVMRLIQAAGQISDWWKGLDSDSKSLIEALGGVLVVWRLLNAEMWKSPVTWVMALVGALLLLWEDYQTWKEGGKSLIDWSKWQPEIEQAKKAFIWLRDTLIELKDHLGGWKNTLELIFGFMVGAKLAGMLGGIGKITGAFGSMAQAIGNVLGGLGNLTKAIANIALRNPWLLMFVPTNNTPTTSEELATIGGVGANIDPAELKKAQDWQKEHPGEVYVPGNERGIRNNNPGNIEFAGQAGATSDGRFAQFRTPLEGLRAMSRQLLRYYDGKTTGKPLHTVSDIVSTWAPPTKDGKIENDTLAYIAHISQMLGVSPDAQINLRDPNVMATMMNGIIQKENGRNPYGDEMVRAAGTATIGGPSLSQEVNITVNGVSNPQEAANIIAGKQAGIQANGIQQLQTGPR
ncbi:lytic transglycosylase catalytic [Pectobacteriaceae bacterium C52]|nr:lytic transglycosylase catalytic [Pectobacteriaceae bacterium C52]